MREEKATKNIITKETIGRDLLSQNQKTTRFYMILFVVLTVLTSVVFLIFYSLVLKSSDIGIAAWVIFFIAMLICFSPSFFCILSVFRSLSERKILKNVAFFVVTDEVAYKEEKSVTRRGHVYIQKTIHFCKYGDVHVDATCYQLTSNGDMFYLVVYQRDPQTLRKYYPAKMYQYKE